ncbi:hypothetical protein B0H16DRAFT_1584002 [Mycena metata]|uniref:Uncharacterized protein n=1 Tax=Mycena metata TaxID=1033252 RepID=A0AAD7I0K6_9AGAR|nr:hypothetical protein B0H16DRAFT_1584002 [Mycena metata]
MLVMGRHHARVRRRVGERVRVVRVVPGVVRVGARGEGRGGVRRGRRRAGGEGGERGGVRERGRAVSVSVVPRVPVPMPGERHRVPRRRGRRRGRLVAVLLRLLVPIDGIRAIAALHAAAAVEVVVHMALVGAVTGAATVRVRIQGRRLLRLDDHGRGAVGVLLRAPVVRGGCKVNLDAGQLARGAVVRRQRCMDLLLLGDVDTHGPGSIVALGRVEGLFWVDGAAPGEVLVGKELVVVARRGVLGVVPVAKVECIVERGANGVCGELAAACAKVCVGWGDGGLGRHCWWGGLGMDGHLKVGKVGLINALKYWRLRSGSCDVCDRQRVSAIVGEYSLGAPETPEEFKSR